MAGRRKKPVTRKKAKKILRHGSVRGKKLTKKQKGLFGLVAGGKTPTKVQGRKRKRSR